MEQVQNKIKNMSSIVNKSQNYNKPNVVNTQQQSNPILSLFLFIFCIVLFYFIIKFAIYIYYGDCKKVDVATFLTSFTFNPCIEKPVKVKDVIKVNKKEVFHIANQKYTFEEAKCKCKEIGARLATKAELMDAYKRGANWCSYGWSAGKQAYYPVQNQDMFDDPILISKCGSPGLNGGYFNTDLKFGINCFGFKPGGKDFTPVQKSKPKEFCALDEVKDLISSSDDKIMPFNKSQWSMYN